jgi:hypothetical protein
MPSPSVKCLQPRRNAVGTKAHLESCDVSDAICNRGQCFYHITYLDHEIGGSNSIGKCWRTNSTCNRCRAGFCSMSIGPAAECLGTADPQACFHHRHNRTLPHNPTVYAVSRCSKDHVKQQKVDQRCLYTTVCYVSKREREQEREQEREIHCQAEAHTGDHVTKAFNVCLTRSFVNTKQSRNLDQPSNMWREQLVID